MQIVNLFEGELKNFSQRLIITNDSIAVETYWHKPILLREGVWGVIPEDEIEVRDTWTQSREEIFFDRKYLPAILEAIKKEVEG